MTLNNYLLPQEQSIVDHLSELYTSQLTHLIEEELVKNIDNRLLLPVGWLVSLGVTIVKVIQEHSRFYVKQEEMIINDLQLIMQVIQDAINMKNITLSVQVNNNK